MFKQRTQRYNACTCTQYVHCCMVGQRMYEWIIPLDMSSFFSFFFSFTAFLLPINFFYFVFQLCRDRASKTEQTEENFTRPILPLSTFCVLHQLTVKRETYALKRRERQRENKWHNIHSTVLQHILWYSSFLF